jgi:hypothetical protein
MEAAESRQKAPQYTDAQWNAFWATRTHRPTTRREIDEEGELMDQRAAAVESEREAFRNTPNEDTRPAADPVRQARLEEALRIASYLSSRGHHCAIPSPTFVPWP